MDDIKLIFQRYAKYIDGIEALSKISLALNPTIESVGIKNATIQACYREMRDIGFKDGVLDYLCYINTLYIMHEWHEIEDGKADSPEDPYLFKWSTFLWKRQMNLSLLIRYYDNHNKQFFEISYCKKMINAIDPELIVLKRYMQLKHEHIDKTNDHHIVKYTIHKSLSIMKFLMIYSNALPKFFINHMLEEIKSL